MPDKEIKAYSWAAFAWGLAFGWYHSYLNQLWRLAAYAAPILQRMALRMDPSNVPRVMVRVYLSR